MTEELRRLRQRASALAREGHWDSALRLYQRAVREEPSDLTSRVGMADALAALGKKAEAIEEYQHLAGYWAADGQPLKAMAMCQAILDLDRSHRETQRVVADLYAKHRDKPRVTALPASMTGSFTNLPVQDPGVTEDLDGAPRTGRADAEAEIAKAPVPSEVDPSRLPDIPLFSDLSPEEFVALVGELKRHDYQAGEPIVKQGERGSSMFLLVRGVVRVMRENAANTWRVPFIDLQESSFFGEMALFTDEPRTATVVAANDVTVLELSRERVEKLKKEYPGVARTLEETFRRRMKENSGEEPRKA